MPTHSPGSSARGIIGIGARFLLAPFAAAAGYDAGIGQDAGVGDASAAAKCPGHCLRFAFVLTANAALLFVVSA